MNKQNSDLYLELYKIIENLYSEDRYEDIISLVNENENIDFLDMGKTMYYDFVEILSVSYIESGNIARALEIVDPHIEHIIKNKNDNSSYMDDILVFFSLKIQIYRAKNSTLKQLSIIRDYKYNGGSDPEIIDFKSALEEDLYYRYVIFNRILLIVWIATLLFSIFDLYLLNDLSFLVISSVCIFWFMINIVFVKKIKMIFLGLIVHFY